MSSSVQNIDNILSLLDNLASSAIVARVGALFVTYVFLKTASFGLFNLFPILFEYVFAHVPTIKVPLEPMEEKDHADGERTKKVGLKDLKRRGLIQCFDPSTGMRLGEVKAMTVEEVGERVEVAKEAQREWSKTTFKQRRLVLRTIQKYIVNNIEPITRVCSRDSGKPKVDALLGEVMTTCEKIRCINSEGEKWLEKSYRTTGPMMVHKSAYVEYVPLGVLGVIAPWNYPFHNMLNHVISGLFSGNAVVSKVSEHTSWSSGYFTRIVRAALEANGHNPDVVQTITGFGEAGAALVAHPDVDKIIFTGSPAVGKLVMAGAAPHLKPVILELGGKDPMVFTEDVKVEEVIPWAMRGCYQNCGQNCCGVERLFVYEGVYEEFLDVAERKVKALRQGVPLKCGGEEGEVDCGAMVMDGQIGTIQELIDDAVEKGARLHCGGRRNTDVGGGFGQFYEPTLISGITNDMRISQEEVFGPVMCVVKVEGNDDERCIEMINNCPFGLGSSVYSRSKERAKGMGERIRSGMFTANDFGVNYLIQSLPFGGVKESGFDRFAGPEGLRACCLERSMVIDRIPFVKTSIPGPINYPINTKKGLLFGGSLIGMLYNESWIGKIMAVVGIIKASA